MITLTKEILMHPDFMTNLADELCRMLEAVIDAEFDKGDDTDFDFIDECAEAINAIRTGDDAQIIPLISRKDFLGKIGIRTERKFKIFIAAGAAIALLFAVGSQVEFEEGVTFNHALSGIVSDFFTENEYKKTETTQPATTTSAATTAASSAAVTTTQKAATTTEKPATLINISVETTPEFRTEYYVGEEFSNKGIKVFGEYDNGERLLVRINDFTVEVSDDFGKEAKYETVKISVGNFTQTLEVRVMENLETKKLTSIYAIFPDDFEFTAEELNSIDLSGMQIFAVYSDGSEKELSADEYTVKQKFENKLFEKNVTITVEHEDCSCSFVVYEK